MIRKVRFACIFVLTLGITFTTLHAASTTEPQTVEDKVRSIRRAITPECTSLTWHSVNYFKSQTVKQNYHTRFASGTAMQENLGNDEGIHEMELISIGGKEALDKGNNAEMYHNILRNPVKTLLDENGLHWVRTGTSNHVHVSELGSDNINPFVNPLVGAVTPVGGGHFEGGCNNPLGVPDYLWSKYAVYEEQETKIAHGKRYSVSYGLKESVVEVAWDFDDRQGNNPVRCSMSLDGKQLYSSEAKYELVGSEWLSKQVSYHDHTAEEGSRCYYQVVVEQVEPGDPTIPKEGYTPHDLGIGLGHMVYQYGSKGIQYWDGVSIISLDERTELIYLAGIDPHPDIIERDRTQAGMSKEEYFARLEKTRANAHKHYREKHGHDYVVTAPEKPGEKDAWDVYVDDFIKKHELKGDVVQEMLSFRDECKRQRDWYRRNHKKYQEESAEKGDDRKLKAMDEHVDRIFNKRLKPGLESLRRKHSDPATVGS